MVRLFSRRSPEEASVPERLERCVEKRDVPGLLRLLDGLDDEGGEAARSWYRKARTSIRKSTNPATMRRFDRMVPAVQVEAVLCVALAPPASAAKWLRWEWLTQAAQVVTPVVVRRGAEWCAAFVPAADMVPSRADSWGLSQAVYEVLRETVDAHDLPTPAGEPFVEGWMQAITPSIDWQQGGPNIPDQEEVVRRLRAEPRLTDLVAPTIAHPQIGQHAYLAAGFATLAAEGLLAREQLVHLCLAGLDSPGRPAAQKALAEALVALGLRGDELPGGLARLQQLMATCHGSVTARLLPLALALVATEEDLVELTTTVAARPEKKQRTDLLRAVTTGPLTEAVPAAGRRAALEILAESPDAALAGKASRALESLGGGAFTVAAVAPAGLGLWELAPPPDASQPPTPCPEVTAFDERAVDAIRAAAVVSSWQQPPPWQQPQALALVVRWAFRDGPRAVRRALGDLELPPYDANAFGPALASWLAKRLPAAYEPIVPLENGYVPYASNLAERHLRESLYRAGRAPFLLSTPTHTDASLDFGVLVERLRHSSRVGFGPLDLLQAVLRLGPVDPGRAADLDGLDVVRPDVSAGTRTRVTDAVAYVRDLVASGSLQPTAITVARMAAEGWVPDKVPPPQGRLVLDPENQPADGFWAAMLPVSLDDFDLGVDDLTARVRPRVRAPRRVARRLPVAPRPAAAARWALARVRRAVAGPRTPRRSRAAFGPACHDLLLGGYAADRPGSRQEIVDRPWPGSAPAATPASPDWPPPGPVAHGRLNLARCAAAWEQVFLSGGMRATWPVALGTAGFAAELPRKPAGLADLLRMLTSTSARFRTPNVPAAVAAAGRGEGHDQEPRRGPTTRRRPWRHHDRHGVPRPVRPRRQRRARSEAGHGAGAYAGRRRVAPDVLHRLRGASRRRPPPGCSRSPTSPPRRYADLGLAKRLANLDPVVTASGDRLRFESFSACNGVYARFDLMPDGIDSGEVGFGTTNVDINPPLRAALASVPRGELLHLAVGSDELRVVHPGRPPTPSARCRCRTAGCAASPRRRCCPGPPRRAWS